MSKIFVIFPSRDKHHAEAIASAAEAASTNEVTYSPWSRQDGSGSPVDRAVEGWLNDADGIVADVTFVNDNVTYEIGYGIGSQKPVRLVRNSSVDTADLVRIGLLDTLIRDEFRTRAALEQILRNRAAPSNKWPHTQRNERQPIYVLGPPEATNFSSRLFSAVKKQTRFKFRSFKSWEIGRLTAQEVWEQVAASFGVVVSWQDGTGIEAQKNNQRAALIFGMARGLDIPALLIAHERAQLPADLIEQATRYTHLYSLETLLRNFRDEVQDALNDYNEELELPYTLWPAISTPMLNGAETMDFLVSASMMRPRYLIRLFETAKRRAVNMAHQRIQEDDYRWALQDIGWTAMEDLQMELKDIVHDTDKLLFDIQQLSGACGLQELRDAIAHRSGATDVIERVLDVLLWSGAIGIDAGNGPRFIYDCGYKLQFLRSLIDRNEHAEVCIHPTLANLASGTR